MTPVRPNWTSSAKSLAPQAPERIQRTLMPGRIKPQIEEEARERQIAAQNNVTGRAIKANLSDLAKGHAWEGSGGVGKTCLYESIRGIGISHKMI